MVCRVKQEAESRKRGGGSGKKGTGKRRRSSGCFSGPLLFGWLSLRIFAERVDASRAAKRPEKVQKTYGNQYFCTSAERRYGQARGLYRRRGDGQGKLVSLGFC